MQKDMKIFIKFQVVSKKCLTNRIHNTNMHRDTPGRIHRQDSIGVSGVGPRGNPSAGLKLSFAVRVA